MFVNDFKTSTHIIPIATLVGGVLELLWMMYFLFRNGYKLSFFKFDVSQKMISIIKNIIPMIIASGVTHINTWVSMLLLSFFPGGLSYMYYADRIIQLPLALIGTTIGAVLLPKLAKKLELTDQNKTYNLANHAINLVMMFTIPAAMGIFFLAKRIIYSLFERVEFTALSTINTSNILQILILTLPAFVLIKLFQTNFYAKMNIKIPVLISITCILINILVSILLIKKLQYFGIAIANVIASWSNIVILIIYAHKFLKFKLQRFTLIELVKYVVASVMMIISFFIFENIVVNVRNNFLLLHFEILIGLVNYFIVCYLLKVEILKQLIGMVKKSLK